MPGTSVGIMSRTQRGVTVAAAALLAVVVMTACTPDPAPSPTPTGFASEEEAFAAAEATYRAYVDAGNAMRVDPTHAPTPSSYLTGEALTDSLDGQAQLEEAGLRLSGNTEVLKIRDDAWTASEATITVCLGLQSVRVLDETGADVTPASRGDRSALEVDVIYAAPSPLIISSRVGTGGC